MTTELSGKQIALGVALQVIVTMALTAWGGWVARRRGNGRFWRFARWTPWASFALLGVGLIVSVVLLVRTFGAVSTVDAAHKARALSDGIAKAMTATALLMVPGYGLLLLGVVSFVVGSLRADVSHEPPGK